MAGSVQGPQDLVTATIFERLSYLPAPTAWQLLADASGDKLHPYRVVDITGIEFRPMWSNKERALGVEPDVFITLDLGGPARKVHVIVEAKHGAVQSPIN